MTGSMTDWGLYIHVPWCRVSCAYCAFYHQLDRGHDWAPFVDALLAEHAAHRAAFPGRPASIYLGGGTPSRMPPEHLARLLHALDPAPDAEIGAEANPEDVDTAWLDGAMEAGINRLSLGVQTFDPRQARRLNRVHTVAQARDVIARVAASGLRSWSVDLMFALPGQTLADLEAELDALLALEPPHVSLYGLTYEPDTPLALALARGQVQEVDDDLWRAMYDRIVARLEAAGISRYEVSNFARDGHRSRHNTLYWTGAPYLGLGPAAHSFGVDGARWHNPRDLAAWMGSPPGVAEREVPTPHEAAADHLVSCLRGVEGVRLDTLAARTGHVPARRAILRLVSGGVLQQEGSRLRLTPLGFPIADTVVGALCEALIPSGTEDAHMERIPTG